MEICEGEVWKDIPNYVGLYQVSNFGRIKCLERTLINSNGKISIRKSKLLNGCKSRYYSVLLCKNSNNHKLHLAHRLVATSFIPNPENKPEVNHIDGNKLNNHVNNLEWVTHRENENHALINNLKAIGIKNGNAKLNNEIVKQIRSKYIPRKYTNKMIAKEFNISYHSAQLITSGNIWKI